MAAKASRVLLPFALAAGLVSATPAVAEEPATPPMSDRAHVLASWKEGGPAVKSAAGSALAGNDEQIRAYLDAGQKVAEDLDLREAALKLVTEAGPGLSEAARNALDGTPEQLAAFMKTGWQAPLADDQRVEASRIAEGGGPGTREAGEKAMRGSIEDIKAFLTEGQYRQRDDDARVRVSQIETLGGPSTKRAAGEALRGTIEDIREFLTFGQHIARAQDQEYATISDLAKQTKAAQAAAEKARKSAQEQADKAKAAAALAKQETAKAAAETKAAKSDARRAEDAARRAAESARRAASAAQSAVSSARAANSAAQAAAVAAHNASTAALYASQAASRAWEAAASGKVNESAAADAQRAAEAASLIADSADAVKQTLYHSTNALNSALAAIEDMNAAADSATESHNASKQAGVHSDQAQAASASARRHAAEARRAAEAARAHSAEAVAAATESATAARSAADHARKAATAARKANEHANDAQAAANAAKVNAAEALKAANNAGEAVKKAQLVQDKARKREAEEIAARTNTLVNRARDARDLYIQAKAEANRLLQERGRLDTDFTQLTTQAETSGADPAQIAATGRQMAVTALEVRGPWSRAAAEAALVGDDEDVLSYAADGWRNAAEQDDRQQVGFIAQRGAYADLRDAAATVLKGSAAEVRAFLAVGQYQAAAPDRRIEVARIAEAGGPGVKEAASTALHATDSRALEEFLQFGQHQARLEDDRVEAARLAEGGTPEVKAAAETALASPDTQLRAFIETGQYRAKRRDQLTAAHIAQVKAIIASAQMVAAQAYRDASKAAASASKAQGYADEAANHAAKADDYAAEADKYAVQAKTSAADARKSADEAVRSAATATKAEKQAARSSARADNSAAAAYASSQVAASYAASAFEAAESARLSAIRAGTSADDARQLHQQTVRRYQQDQYDKAMKRLAEEAEARKRELAKIGIGAVTFLLTGQLPPGTPIGVRLDLIHGSLDILGMIPGLGEPADGVNCGMYAVEGIVEYFNPFGRDGAWLDAGLACASMVPIGGWGTTPLKWTRYSEKYGPDLKKVFDELSGIFRKAPGCRPGKNSFPRGTRVLMSDGSTRPIEKVRAGELVQAADPITGITGPRRVEATIYTPQDRDFTEITLGHHGQSSVTTTDHHLFWSETSRTWTDAADLEKGEVLRTADGTTAVIGQVRHWKQPQPAFNLTVNGLHTFYVLAGATPVLTHNDDCSNLFAPNPTGYDGWQHVLEGHIAGSPLSPGKTVFHVYGSGAGGRYDPADLDEIGDLISDTVANTRGMPNTGTNPDGTPRDGLVYQEDFGYPIGKDKHGNPLDIVEVIVNPDGTLRTAYPIPRSQYRR
ncbi:polymorphic toxin-type HINT domain-containing protein [Streptomyces sp. NPDC058861]|uniref:polymorphic toxin-type HINT domain-containing protein n=1 Tax=Streptomyces sp. NPDC058861 TaxID=3346653 RepID=UPI0036C94010